MAVVGLWAGQSRAHPDDPEYTDAGMDDAYETVVTGFRVAPTDQGTAFGETIDVSETADRLETVSEVLSDAAGVQVRRLGGLGSTATASIRGSTSSQVPVFLDGLELNSGGFPSVDLGDLDLDTLESIEVYRGRPPLSLGGAGIGGALVLKTRRFDAPVTEAAASYGSWNTFRLLLLRGDTLGPVDVLAILSPQHSDGDFAYLNRNGTPRNPDDDAIVRRSNNAHTAFSTLLKASADAAGATWTVADDFMVKREGVPGIESVPTEHASLRTLKNALAANVETSVRSSVKARVEAGYLALREDFDDSQNEVGVGFQRTRSASDEAGGGVALEIAPHPDHTAAVRLGSRYDRFSTGNLLLDAGPAPSDRVRADVGLEHAWRFVETAAVIPSFRLDLHHSRSPSARSPYETAGAGTETDTTLFWSPSLGARWEIVEGLTVRANAGRYNRPADLSELFGDRGSVTGNSDLDPEVGINADAGLTYLLHGQGGLSFLRLDAAWFGSWVDDLIAYVQNSQSTVRPENVSSAEILGAEAGFRLSVEETLDVAGNYTYLHGVNTSDIPYYHGQRLPGRPVHEAYAKVEIRHGFGGWGLGLWMDGDYAGQNYLDQANLKEDALARLLFGLGTRIELSDLGVKVTVEARNLFDTIAIRDDEGLLRPLRDFEGFPLPGRTILGTVHWRI